jgi:hypothetical protein
MHPGFSQLAVLWEREKTQSIAFGSTVVVDGTFKRRLKPDATPNVPLASPNPEKKNGETPVVQHLHIPRGALQKRQKAEVCDF